MIDGKSDFRAPPRAASIGLWLFLAALAMLFISSMWLYVLKRLQIFGRTSNDAIHMPDLAWASTAVLLSGSFTIHRAVAAIRRERLKICLKYLYITCGIAVLFLVVQTPCMVQVLDAHRAIEARTAHTGVRGISPVSLYGLVFVLILVHALHVVGGIIALVVVTVHAHRQKYDHENYMGVQFAARYWHFLDVVWVGMFTMFLVMG